MFQPVDPTADLWHQQFLILQQNYTILQQECGNVLNQLSVALQSIANQSTEIRILKDEIARLKGTSPRPKLPSGRLEGPGSGSESNKDKDRLGRGKHPRKNKVGLNFHNQERLKPDNIPQDAIFKGTRKYDVQNIICRAYNTRYIIERWRLPDGTYIEGQLPTDVRGHYGVELRAHVLMLAYSGRMTEELILEQLHRYKIAISAGQLHTMLTEEHNDYHAEKAAEIERVRDDIWQLYKELKTYKEFPNEQERLRLTQSFDSLFKPEKLTPYQVLNDRLALTYAKRDRLLFVLEHPTTPLHNNLSETGGRGAKVKSKISGGTRSDEGRRAWDTFGSLNLTCRRLGICFYEYLMDRFLDLKKISRLGDIIRIRLKVANTPVLTITEAMKMAFNTS